MDLYFPERCPISYHLGGALAYGVTSGHPGVASRRLLLLVEGLPTISMAAAAYRVLPVSPEKARFLTQEEILLIKARGVRQVGNVARIGPIVRGDIGSALIDIKAWFTAVSVPSRSWILAL